MLKAYPVDSCALAPVSCDSIDLYVAPRRVPDYTMPPDTEPCSGLVHFPFPPDEVRNLGVTIGVGQNGVGGVVVRSAMVTGYGDTSLLGLSSEDCTIVKPVVSETTNLEITPIETLDGGYTISGFCVTEDTDGRQVGTQADYIRASVTRRVKGDVSWNPRYGMGAASVSALNGLCSELTKYIDSASEADPPSPLIGDLTLDHTYEDDCRYAPKWKTGGCASLVYEAAVSGDLEITQNTCESRPDGREGSAVVRTEVFAESGAYLFAVAVGGEFAVVANDVYVGPFSEPTDTSGQQLPENVTVNLSFALSKKVEKDDILYANANNMPSASGPIVASVPVVLEQKLDEKGCFVKFGLSDESHCVGCVSLEESGIYTVFISSVSPYPFRKEGGQHYANQDCSHEYWVYKDIGRQETYASVSISLKGPVPVW